MKAPAPLLTIAAPSFINEVLLPRVASRYALRGLTMPHSLIRRYARDNLFDAAVTIGSEQCPESWAGAHVGELVYGLFASPSLAHELGFEPSVDAIRTTPFVAAVYVSPEGKLVPGDDRCPLGRDERRIGHEVETMALACRIAADTDHLVFGPVLSAASFVSSGGLVEVHVPGWSQADALYLACNPETVRPAVQDAIAASIRLSFGALPRASGIVAISDATALEPSVRTRAQLGQTNR